MSFWQQLRRKKGFDEALERYGSDAEFREQLQTNFEAAIRGYSLTAEEKQVLRQPPNPKITGHASRVFAELMDKYRHY